MAAVDNRLQVRIGEDEAAWLADRAKRMMSGSRDVQARAELGIWRIALATELRRIRLTLAQANCLADVLNGTLIQPAIAASFPVVFAEVSDAFQLATGPSSYGAKWEIDEGELLSYLRGLGPTADHALHDAVSRWWEQDCQVTAEGWARVGLRVV